MSYNGFNLDNMVAFITGGGRGIGKAVALGMAEAGADVAVCEIPDRMDLAVQTTEDVKELGRKTKAYELDVSSISQIQPTVDQVVKDFGHLDILVNNAGVRLVQEAMSITEKDWDFTVDINLKGTFFCSQASAHHMIKQEFGRIINISSQLSQTGMYNRAHYCASKGGVTNLTRALAVEWAKLGITVNAIGPGPTETPMVQTMDRNQDEVNKFIQTYSPMGRRLQVEEIVGAAIYLASPSTTGTTGHLLLVDGGWTAW
jgi:NAD(P)-dependent dehydrogenase (short-subunit alcohol dehydrogenase family)